eukprot:TRINITY_DN3898_c4_g1_i2.p1 TRINITY_DN3898_c4_g1~~TRINITY_DN3898_c4_g1_i2.p1  ORF type:complete len:240 (-),score=21.61 TRINITY_DN3898_c4_g1_i2:93-812(-)
MLRGWGVAYEGGLLTKVHGDAGVWDSGAVLVAGDAFEAHVDFDVNTTPTFILGITRASSMPPADSDRIRCSQSLLRSFVSGNPEGCFLEVLATSGYPRLCSCNAEGNVEPKFLDDFGALISGLTIRYEDGLLSFQSGHRCLGPIRVPHGNGEVYRPCLLLCSMEKSVSIRCQRKRLWRPSPSYLSLGEFQTSDSDRPLKERRCLPKQREASPIENGWASKPCPAGLEVNDVSSTLDFRL